MIELDEVTCPVCGKEQPYEDNCAIGYPYTWDTRCCNECSKWESEYEDAEIKRINAIPYC